MAKIGPWTPDCYIELANQCMDSYPKKHPKSSEMIIKLNEWLNTIGSEIENKIKSQFLESDEINKKFSTIKEI